MQGRGGAAALDAGVHGALADGEHHGHRLPSEAEWEYAARAGSKTRYSFGDDEKNLGKYAWYGDNSGGQAHPVARKDPNGSGLYDLYGNVWEWVQDCWHDDYTGAPTDGSAWEGGTCEVRVLRGGAFFNPAVYLRSAVRYWVRAESRDRNFGFRCARGPRRQP